MKKLGKHRLWRGDCLKKLRKLPDNSVDSIVTDPPYGLSFMGKKWDTFAGEVNPGRDGGKGNKGIIKGSGRGGKTQDRIKFKSLSNMNMLAYMTPIFEECLRVLKPGGYILAFAGTRTQHIMAMSIEQAGFEIRDIVAWTYSQGFPKSVNVGKMIDKELGHVRKTKGAVKAGHEEFVGRKQQNFMKFSRESGGFDRPWMHDSEKREAYHYNMLPESKEAAQWEGWGSALKPAFEPITMARKPFDTTLAKNVLKYGTGALNIDGCRVSTSDVVTNHARSSDSAKSKGKYGDSKAQQTHQTSGQQSGRFPANFIHDGSEEVTSLFPYSKDGVAVSRNKKQDQDSGNKVYGKRNVDLKDVSYGGSGSVSRFFYCAKANKKDRDEGNNHPTVKPTDLMRYLVRLVTRKGGVCLDPFMGSGSTGKACVTEGMIFYGMEREKESFVTSVRRVRKARKLKRAQATEKKTKTPVKKLPKKHIESKKTKIRSK